MLHKFMLESYEWKIEPNWSLTASETVGSRKVPYASKVDFLRVWWEGRLLPLNTRVQNITKRHCSRGDCLLP